MMSKPSNSLIFVFKLILQAFTNLEKQLLATLAYIVDLIQT